MEINISIPEIEAADLEEVDLLPSKFIQAFSQQAKDVLESQFKPSYANSINLEIDTQELEELIAQLTNICLPIISLIQHIPQGDRLELICSLVLQMRSKTEDFIRIKTLERQIVKDPLTGIANKVGLEAFYDKLDFNKPNLLVGCIRVDLDGFKQINDQFGHRVGDAVLQKAAQALSRAIRWPKQEVARVGGDEFTVVLSEIPAERANETAKNIFRKATDLLHEMIKSDPSLELLPYFESYYPTFSMGAVFVPYSSDHTFESLDAAADANALRAKQAGKNRIVI